MTLALSTAATEYLRYNVTATAAGVAKNPTTDTVQFAFTASSQSPPVTYFAGSWETANGAYFAICLVGPAGGVTTLAVGTWTVWIKVTDTPEVPVRNVGLLVVS